MIKFHQNYTGLESKWHLMTLFEKNSGICKFAFEKSLLELIDRKTNSMTKTHLVVPFAKYITVNLRQNYKQVNAVLNSYNQFINLFLPQLT